VAKFSYTIRGMKQETELRFFGCTSEIDQGEIRARAHDTLLMSFSMN
jgi:hypothetical protein